MPSFLCCLIITIRRSVHHSRLLWAFVGEIYSVSSSSNYPADIYMKLSSMDFYYHSSDFQHISNRTTSIHSPTKQDTTPRGNRQMKPKPKIYMDKDTIWRQPTRLRNLFICLLLEKTLKTSPRFFFHHNHLCVVTSTPCWARPIHISSTPFPKFTQNSIILNIARQASRIP